jgi:hypothetical protein
LSKPAAAIYGAYGWSETYPATTWANPDDILLENWRTTDVAPGTYHLYAKNLDGTVYEDLGTHTFVAEKPRMLARIQSIYLNQSQCQRLDILHHDSKP